MPVSFTEFADELRRFDQRREVLNALRRDLRKPLPEVRAAVRASAKATLPKRNGLADWVARSAIRVQVKDVGRTAGIRVKMGRKAADGDKADLDKLDRHGRIRHPLRGNRAHWYDQPVPAGFFSKAWARQRDTFIRVADEALDRALEVIRRG